MHLILTLLLLATTLIAHHAAHPRTTLTDASAYESYMLTGDPTKYELVTLTTFLGVLHPNTRDFLAADVW